MKAFYLTASIVFTVILLILAFENIGSSWTETNFLFYTVDWSPTIIILGISVLGIITGALYHAFIHQVLTSSEDEEDGENM